MAPSADSRWPALALLGCLSAFALGQEATPATTPTPVLHAAFAAAPARHQVPALAWLCERHLPARREWPATLDPRQAFAVRIDADGMRILPTTIVLPPGTVATGSCTIGAGQPLLFECRTDGTEDWFVPLPFEAPAAWLQLLAAIDGHNTDVPHTLDAAVIAGHLAGGLVEGDPRAELLRLGASACGDVTWLAFRQESMLRVRGRSEGGLMLPAALLALAADRTGGPDGLQLRAFGARDVDRAEAARRLLGSDDQLALPTLRALLFADDATRLAAIDTLVRRHCTDELPAIVAAASAAMPWSTLAAEHAVRELWLDADPLVRQRTRAALQRSDSVQLRSIDTERLPRRVPATAELPTHGEPSDGGLQARALILLGLLTIGIAGLWQRERLRLQGHDSAA
ncbi:MAG: hypothetical protein MUC36_26070 [Planctomycetes bacterium]|jgi:hypothetical protein|nr:hypothetical protein [Planctomycetota bacterium]